MFILGNLSPPDQVWYLMLHFEEKNIKMVIFPAKQQVQVSLQLSSDEE